MLRVWCFLCALNVLLASPINRNATNVMLDTINSHGYVAEKHFVTTEDGYILGVYRIPYARHQTSGNESRPVVFCMHGLYGQSQNFILGDPDLAIGFNLADAGFDVWMGNYRGNAHSREHVSLNPDSAEESMAFFDFSWEEIGMIDIPAMIDYVLVQTGNEKLHYIGHSQGGTTFLVMGTMRPEYNEKMESVHLLAGVGYQDYFPNEELASLATFTDIIYGLALSMGLVEFTPTLIDDVLGELGDVQVRQSDLCFGDIKYRYMCELIGARHFMRDTDEEDEFSLDGFGGGSIKQIAHYGQNIRDKLFRRFHYGTNDNQALYGSDTPPLYDLGLITSNVVMHYTLSDDLLDERDVLAMAADMPNTVVRKVARESFLHNDFITASDAKELVTDYIITSINNIHYGITEEPSVPIGEPTTLAPTTVAPTTVSDSAPSISSHLQLIALALCTFLHVLS